MGFLLYRERCPTAVFYPFLPSMSKSPGRIATVGAFGMKTEGLDYMPTICAKAKGMSTMPP